MSTAKLPLAESSRSSLIAQNQLAATTNAILQDLADASYVAYPKTTIMFYPRMVGYDNAAVRAQWEEQYIEQIGGMQGQGEMATFTEWAVEPLGSNFNGSDRTAKLGYFTTKTKG